MKKIYIDTETAGLCGPIILFQYSIDDSPVVLVDIWKQKIQDIIDLFETTVQEDTHVIMFNAAFDWFHIYQMWTVLRLMDHKDKVLEDCISEYAHKEIQGRECTLCMKPYHITDIMLVARETKYQSTMARSDIKIRKVPVILAQRLADELNKRIKLSSIYFAKRKKDREIPWKIFSTKDPEFADVVLKFAASSGLKALAIDALGLDPDETLYYGDVGIPKSLMPYELPYAPFYTAIPESKKSSAWPSLIRQHIAHWAHNKTAREYAKRDVEYTRALYKHLSNNTGTNGNNTDDNNPDTNVNSIDDNDNSILACLVAVCRWRGYRVDLDRIRNLREQYKRMVEPGIGFDPDHVPTAPRQVLDYVSKGMSQVEKDMFLSRGSTGKIILEGLIKDFGTESEVGIRVKKVQEARDAKYIINFLNKLVQAGRLHPDLSVVGTLSSRMAGKGMLNVTGIKRTKEIRSCFPLANQDEGYELNAGDYQSFEVALAAAAYNDKDLTKDLLTCYKCGYEYKTNELNLDKCPQCKEKDSRLKIHGIFATELFPGNSYEQIMASKGTNYDMYGLGKNGVFTMIYGGTKETLVVKYGIPLEVATRAEIGFSRKYKNVKIAREKIFSQFMSMRQPRGIGTQVIWAEPSEYIESLLGFKRYFILENMICKTLFDLANSPPKSWRELKIPIIRRDRIQMVGGAVQSALYAAAFSIQSSSMRASCNHVIQSTGAQITKRLQTAIWDLQPKGIHEWIVQPLNCHDEVLVPTKREYRHKLRTIVNEIVENYRHIVPLISIDWKENISSWAKK